MNKEDIITVNANEEYMILDTLELNNSKYLFCVQVDKNDMPTKEYRYFKGIKENEECFIEEILILCRRRIIRSGIYILTILRMRKLN